MSPKSQNVPGASENNSGTSTPSAAKDTPGMASSGRQSPASAINETVSAVLLNMSDALPNAGNDSASSQAQEKSVVNGSKSTTSKETGSGTASPYGTRSRNRTGASRPNYAEDKDLDAEMFEPDRRDDDSKKATRQAGSANASQGAAPAPRPNNGSSTRKPLPTESTHHAANKEQTATSTGNSTPAFAATPTPSNQPSRKRKAATSSQASTPVASHVQQVSSNGTTTTTQRRPAAISHNGLGYSETNLLTFENCAGRPKDGKMIADDGTVLEVNGECHDFCWFWSFVYSFIMSTDFIFFAGGRCCGFDVLGHL